MKNEARDKLIELLHTIEDHPEKTCPRNEGDSCDGCEFNTTKGNGCDTIARRADYLIKNGVTVTPFVAMVNQFIKNGKFDNKRTAHNGKYAVVYIDETKWKCPLIDITEQFYNDEKAKERIQTLKGSADNA